MRKVFKQYFFMLMLLIGSSVALYAIHFFIFSNVRETISGIILSLAYVPIGVFYNILVADKFIEKQEQFRDQKKMNIIIGSFYHEVGTNLIKLIVPGDRTINDIGYCCKIDHTWTKESFDELSKTVKDYKCILDIEDINLELLRKRLDVDDNFILNLLINPGLDEYNEVSAMLMALLHLRDELVTRTSKGELKRYEKMHITKDICRAYKELLVQWVEYMKILKEYYPALFVKALIMSPFDNRDESEKDREFLQLTEKDVKD